MKKRTLLIGTLAANLFIVSCGSGNTETKTTQTTTPQETVVQETHTADVKKVEVVKLEQVAGAFTNGNIELAAGTYSFEVSNNGVGHDVGLVVAPKKEEITADDHLANAYVSEVVKDGETQASKGEVTLEAGEYVYFCPLNPTPQYTITVK